MCRKIKFTDHISSTDSTYHIKHVLAGTIQSIFNNNIFYLLKVTFYVITNIFLDRAFNNKIHI